MDYEVTEAKVNTHILRERAESYFLFCEIIKNGVNK